MTLFPTRRVVTANDEAGRSFVRSDDATPHILQTGPGRGLMDFWAIGAEPAADAEGDGVIVPMRLDPPAGGSVFRFFQIPPAGDPADREVAERNAAAAFAAMGAAHVRIDTARHPAMHRSETLDYVVVLKGRLRLLLEEGEVDLEPHDVVIQRGTNHAWINLGDEPALCAAVLVDQPRSRARP